MVRFQSLICFLLLAASCGRTAVSAGTDNASEQEETIPAFNADSAMQHIVTQLDFGPRVPGTAAHRLTGDYISHKMKSYGADVIEQCADLKAFDGTILHARNIFASFNPEKERRILLLAHYDTRPWADKDSDPANHTKPVPGANDGASGVAVLLETSRAISRKAPEIGVDILFVDAEDYGTEGDDDSWALGTKYFAENPPVENYNPEGAVLLDMVGGKDAMFPPEYFSIQAAPALDASFRRSAAKAGFAKLFSGKIAGAVTDDHVKLIERGIPAIDIIDYRSEEGFNPTWHTLDDNLQNISPATLEAVGKSLLQFLYDPQ